jgi:hypothetical protein
VAAVRAVSVAVAVVVKVVADKEHADEAIEDFPVRHTSG